MSDETKPLLRWAGSKQKLLPVLARHWSADFNRYIEPFAGSACLFFRVRPKRAILGDINDELINTYRQVKANCEQVSDCLDELKPGRDNYLSVRSMDPESLTRIERAARFIYLNRFCFNGLWRTNQLGQFNVPYGGRKCGVLPDRKNLATVGRLLRRARFVSGDFEEVLNEANEKDFVYMDPPFRVTGRRMFTQYDRSVFRHADLFRLRYWMERLDERGVTFLVSYADGEEANFLSEGFHTTRHSLRRNIAGFTDRRQLFDELLITNQVSRRATC